MGDVAATTFEEAVRLIYCCHFPVRRNWALYVLRICRQKREATSGLENRLPLLQLRAINRALQRSAQACNPASLGGFLCSG
jgi:hypothetical protein